MEEVQRDKIKDVEEFSKYRNSDKKDICIKIIKDNMGDEKGQKGKLKRNYGEEYIKDRIQNGKIWRRLRSINNNDRNIDGIKSNLNKDLKEERKIMMYEKIKRKVVEWEVIQKIIVMKMFKLEVMLMKEVKKEKEVMQKKWWN